MVTTMPSSRSGLHKGAMRFASASMVRSSSTTPACSSSSLRWLAEGLVPAAWRRSFCRRSSWASLGATRSFWTWKKVSAVTRWAWPDGVARGGGGELPEDGGLAAALGVALEVVLEEAAGEPGAEVVVLRVEEGGGFGPAGVGGIAENGVENGADGGGEVERRVTGVVDEVGGGRAQGAEVPGGIGLREHAGAVGRQGVEGRGLGGEGAFAGGEADVEAAEGDAGGPGDQLNGEGCGVRGGGWLIGVGFAVRFGLGNIRSVRVGVAATKAFGDTVAVSLMDAVEVEAERVDFSLEGNHLGFDGADRFDPCEAALGECVPLRLQERRQGEGVGDFGAGVD